MKYLQYLLIFFTTVCLFCSCAKEKSFESFNNLKAQWQFVEAGQSFSGPVDTAFIDTSAGATLSLTIKGKSNDNTDVITITVYGDNLQPRSYKSPYCLFNYYKNGILVYQNDASATDAFEVNITQLDSVSAKGTFSGTVLDATGAIKTIAAGSFYAKAVL
jgi:hypothetical protein